MGRKKIVNDLTAKKDTQKQKAPEFLYFGEPDNPDDEDYEVYGYRGMKIYYNYYGEYDWTVTFRKDKEVHYRNIEDAARDIDTYIQNLRKKKTA